MKSSASITSRNTHLESDFQVRYVIATRMCE